MSNFVIRENISLAHYTTFKLGGLARYFVEVASTGDLIAVIKWAKDQSLPMLVLADGSNLIVSDKGFSGLVIKVGIKELKIDGELLTAGAANSMKELVDQSIDRNLAGLEWAGGLPGSFGGAIRGNAGAFKGEIKDLIESVTTIAIESGHEVTRSNQDCHFGYRESIFKIKGNEVIVGATLKLHSGEKKELRQIADDHIRYRRERHPMEYPNSGSIFKNTPVEKIPPHHLEQWQESIKNDPFPVVPTAKIISEAGLPGLQVGGAQLSTKHCNYIVNLGGATGEDIYELITSIRKIIYQKYGVELEVEPELVGFN